MSVTSDEKQERRLTTLWCVTGSLAPAATSLVLFLGLPQWGAAGAEIKVPSGENTELKRSLFVAWSRSAYSHTYYAYCQGFLPCLFLPFQFIHLHFFQNLSRFFPVLALANNGFCVGPQNKIGQPFDAGSRVECLRNINRLKKNPWLVVWWLVNWITCR